jgi:hypothetical protein
VKTAINAATIARLVFISIEAEFCTIAQGKSMRGGPAEIESALTDFGA